ncbi:carboxylesterase [Streptomyces sp. HCCB10043]|nr:carboxylesterase [Streptomyces sp. HCCB10043]
MTGAWAEFAAHGGPGWEPLDGSAGRGEAVRVWRTVAEGPAGDASGAQDGFRDLWRTAGLPLLAP